MYIRRGCVGRDIGGGGPGGDMTIGDPAAGGLHGSLRISINAPVASSAPVGICQFENTNLLTAITSAGSIGYDVQKCFESNQVDMKR